MEENGDPIGMFAILIVFSLIALPVCRYFRRYLEKRKARYRLGRMPGVPDPRQNWLEEVAFPVVVGTVAIVLTLLLIWALRR